MIHMQLLLSMSTVRRRAHIYAFALLFFALTGCSVLYDDPRNCGHNSTRRCDLHLCDIPVYKWSCAGPVDSSSRGPSFLSPPIGQFSLQMPAVEGRRHYICVISICCESLASSFFLKILKPPVSLCTSWLPLDIEQVHWLVTERMTQIVVLFIGLWSLQWFPLASISCVGHVYRSGSFFSPKCSRD